MNAADSNESQVRQRSATHGSASRTSAPTHVSSSSAGAPCAQCLPQRAPPPAPHRRSALQMGDLPSHFPLREEGTNKTSRRRAAAGTTAARLAARTGARPSPPPSRGGTPTRGGRCRRSHLGPRHRSAPGSAAAAAAPSAAPRRGPPCSETRGACTAASAALTSSRRAHSVKNDGWRRGGGVEPK